jgi:hypothetical protein
MPDWWISASWNSDEDEDEGPNLDDINIIDNNNNNNNNNDNNDNEDGAPPVATANNGDGAPVATAA